jgi:hypothetical protein
MMLSRRFHSTGPRIFPAKSDEWQVPGIERSPFYTRHLPLVIGSLSLTEG